MSDPGTPHSPNYQILRDAHLAAAEEARADAEAPAPQTPEPQVSAPQAPPEPELTDIEKADAEPELVIRLAEHYKATHPSGYAKDRSDYIKGLNKLDYDDLKAKVDKIDADELAAAKEAARTKMQDMLPPEKPDEPDGPTRPMGKSR